MENQTTLKWHQKPGIVILFLIFFFPIGLYLMWKNELWSKTSRIVVSVFFGLLVLGNINKAHKNGPDLGVYDVDGCKTDIYCGNSNYIEFKKEGEDRIIEFYSGSRSNKSCSTFGHFKMDENNNLTIYGLSNPNTFGAAEQFNGEYKWIKGANKKLSFYNSCFYKNNSDVVLLSNQEEN